MEKKIGLSVCLSVLNEKESILTVMTSVLKQRKWIKEIIVVDGGSDDGTWEILLDLAKRDKLIKIYKKAGYNIAKARNFAVSQAKSEYIAFTDAGCQAAPGWARYLLKGLSRDSVDIVAGVYKIVYNSDLQQIFGFFLGIDVRDVKAGFIPSARSVGVRKSFFEKMGGFQEDLDRAEDTEFFLRATRKGAKMLLSKRACVHWQDIARLDWQRFFAKVAGYAYADFLTGIWWDKQKKLATHNLKVLSIFLRYLFFTVLLFLFLSGQISGKWVFLTGVLYLAFVSFKIRRIFSIKRMFLGFLAQIVSDLAVMYGFLKGFFHKFILPRRR